MACGEHELLPAVRESNEDTVIITDGFSCRSQIEQGTGRKAWHLAGRHLKDQPMEKPLVRTGWIISVVAAAATAAAFAWLRRS